MLLCFATWKNSLACYVPGSVKRDTTQFERARHSSDEAVEIIRPHREAARKEDVFADA